MQLNHFFFAQSKEKDAKEVYAKIMDYFIIIVSLIFLGTMLYLDDFILPLLIRNKEYLEGRGVIPVLMMANLFLGVYWNLAIWYKLTGKTSWGAWLSLIGAIITLILNFWWIPLSSDHFIYGYYGSAWATFICYGVNDDPLLSYRSEILPGQIQCWKICRISWTLCRSLCRKYNHKTRHSYC